MTEEESKSPYCPECDACGEEGCCSPTNCIQSPKGDYCSGYLNDLKFNYVVYHKFINELYKDKEKNKEVLEIHSVIWEQLFDIYYKK